MKRNKLNFTMTELLVCFTIVGIIMAMSVQAIKAATSSYTALNYHAFNNMKILVRSMWEVTADSPLTFNNGKSGDDSLVYIKCERDTSNSPTKILKPDVDDNILCNGNDCVGNGFINDETGSWIGGAVPGDSNSDIPKCNSNFTINDNNYNFCQRFAAMANVAGDVRCNARELLSVAYTDSSIDGYEDVPYINNLDPDNPNFTTTNGQRYYISGHVNANEKVSNDFGFRLIAVDLNGTRRPNILSPRNNETGDNNSHKLPDIVTFMILDNGVIFPLGVAGNNKRVGDGFVNYLNTRVRGYNYSDFGEDAEKALDAKCLFEDGQGACRYLLRYIENQGGAGALVGGTGTVGSYRYKFCQSGNSDVNFYDAYCDAFGDNPVAPGCPGNSAGCTRDEDGNLPNNCYDECYADPIKPLFRFNL